VSTDHGTHQVMERIDTSHITDSDLVTAVSGSAHGEREATVALIVYLAEFDARRLFEPAGFSSTFRYCMEILRLSEDAAFNRIEAARVARKYPVVVDMLVAGDLSPTTARMLARHLTAENHAGLLAEAAGKSKQEVETLLARRFPLPDAKPLVRRMAAPELAKPSAATIESAPVPAPGAALPMPTVPAFTPPVVRPLSEDRYVIRFTASAETREKLRLAQDLLGHAVPTGDLAQVFDRALTLLVEELRRRKFAAVRRPRVTRGQSADSRNIPAAVRRVVSARDAGRCAFVSRSGQRCGERRFVEFHHVEPYAVGGEATIDNIQLRCRAHNGYEAVLFHGPPPVPERVARRAVLDA
jgi:hypothetical protein